MHLGDDYAANTPQAKAGITVSPKRRMEALDALVSEVAEAHLTEEMADPGLRSSATCSATSRGPISVPERRREPYALLIGVARVDPGIQQRGSICEVGLD
jgi:hypothetical protein